MSKRPGDFQPQVPRREYDLELAVLDAIRPHPRFTFTLQEIAAVCGVRHSAIRHVEQAALRKLRVLLDQEWSREWLG